MSTLDTNNKEDVSTTLNDSLFDVDLIEVDDLLNSASRLLEEVYSSRPQIAETINLDTSVNSPREDAIEQVQRFLSSIREREEEEEDVVFVEARPGNAPPASARTTAVVDLCTPGEEVSTPETRTSRRRRHTEDIQPIAFPDLATSPSQRSTRNSRKARQQAVKSEPAAKIRSPQKDTSTCTPPTRSSTRGQSKSNAQSPVLPALTCAVCMESVVNRQPSSTSCGHIFCQACIMQAIRLTSKCPLCNTRLNRTKVHRVYF